MLIKCKALYQNAMRSDLYMQRHLSSKPIKGCSSNSSVVVPVEVRETVSNGTERRLSDYTLAMNPRHLGSEGVSESGAPALRPRGPWENLAPEAFGLAPRQGLNDPRD